MHVAFRTLASISRHGSGTGSRSLGRTSDERGPLQIHAIRPRPLSDFHHLISQTDDTRTAACAAAQAEGVLAQKMVDKTIDQMFAPLPMRRTEDPELPEQMRPFEVIEDLQLDLLQNEILDAAVDGHSFFITGMAGTGKSRVIRAILARLRGIGRIVFPTARYGVAAANIGGMTLHSFCGLSATSEPPFTPSARPQVIANIKTVQTLIIDEISTVDNHLLVGLDLYFQKIRNQHGVPFGGYV